MARRKKYGLSFSWRRASGYSAAKGKLSRKIGIPLTRSGRQRKAGQALGCLLPLLTLLIIALLIVVARGQENLPEYGDISDIKSLTKAYLIADSTDARKMILKELKNSNLTIVNSPDDAEFFIEYKVLRHEDAAPGLLVTPPVTASEMTVYLQKDKRRRIVWSKTEDDAGISRPNEVNLTRNFLKALKKVPKPPR